MVIRVKPEDRILWKPDRFYRVDLKNPPPSKFTRQWLMGAGEPIYVPTYIFIPFEDTYQIVTYEHMTVAGMTDTV